MRRRANRHGGASLTRVNRLVPEKRLDKNGRMVTRHVRQDSSAAASGMKVPARPVLTRSDEPTRACERPVKLRRSQREPREVSVSWPEFRLQHSPELTSLRRGYWYHFTASDAEGYDVASVCAHIGDAALLLTLGVRTAGDARALLQSRGLDHLLADQSELTDAALGNTVRFNDFLENWTMMGEERPVADRIGALSLAASALRSVHGIRDVVTQVLTGEIDFEDIRAVGVRRLKDHRMIVHFAPLLARVNAGDDGFSVEALRALADRVAAEKPKQWELGNFARVAAIVGAENAATLPSIDAASQALRSTDQSSRRSPAEIAEELLFTSRFYGAVGPDWHAARAFHSAGVPLEVAVAVHGNGGTPEQALAVQHGAVTAPLAGGYL